MRGDNIPKKSNTTNLKKSEIQNLIPPLNTQLLLNSGTKQKLLHTNISISTKTNPTNHYNNMDHHRQSSYTYQVKQYPPLDNNNIIILSKPQHIISAILESIYTNYHTTYTDTTNSNQLQSYISDKNIPIQPVLKTFKTKKLDSNFPNNCNSTQQHIHNYTCTHNPLKQQPKNNQPVLPSRSLLRHSLLDSLPSQKITSQQPCIPPFFANKNSSVDCNNPPPRSNTVNTTFSKFYSRNPRPPV